MPQLRADEGKDLSFVSGEELLELANTCNFLVSEWARALSDLHDLRRMSSYGDAGSHDDGIRRLEERLADFRDKLTTLRELCITEFSRNYGDTYSIKEPHGFYVHKDKTGRDLEVKVRDAKSRKAAFVRFEKEPNCALIADWLNQHGVLPGKYSQRKTRDGKMVRRVTGNEA
jgi:hypothetical protein